jgi:hypothetical protein
LLCHRGANLHAYAFHRQHLSRRGELSIPLIAAAPIDACLLLAQSGHSDRAQRSRWTSSLFGLFAAAISPATKSSLSAACCTMAAAILQKVLHIVPPIVVGDFLAWLDSA